MEAEKNVVEGLKNENMKITEWHLEKLPTALLGATAPPDSLFNRPHPSNRNIPEYATQLGVESRIQNCV